MSKVWVVGRYSTDTGDGWQVQGIYSTEQLAKSHAEPAWFIGPVQMNTSLPVEPTKWPGAYFMPYTTKATT